MLDVASLPHERLRDESSAAQLPIPRARKKKAAKHLRAAAASFAGPQTTLVQHSAADERVIAVARLVGAMVLVIATPIDPLHTDVTHVLVAAYAVHAATLAAVSAIHPEWLLRHGGVLHAIDLIWAILATAWTGGVASSLFAVFSFVLLSSAFRWGLRGTIRDALIMLLFAVAEAFWSPMAPATPNYPLHIVIIRITYIGIGIGLLFGVLLHRQYAIQFHTLTLAEIVSRVSRASRLQPAVCDALSRVLRLFDARHVLLVVQDVETRAVQRWRADVRTDGSVAVSELTIAGHERRAWMEEESLDGFACELRRPECDGRTAIMTTVLDDGAPTPETVTVPAAIAGASSWSVLVTVPVSLSGVWTGHIYLLDPNARPRGEKRLQLLLTLVQQVGPALVNLYLLGRLRSRAEAVERARISRELHDGPLQALAGLEMRVDVLRQFADDVAPGPSSDLCEVRDQLHDQAIDLRALMQRLRSSEVDSHRLPGELADRISRFSHATGIEARLDWGANGLAISRHQCTETVRIVQEALFNVRRHSGASQVWVRSEINGRAWALVVEDNGRGFEFHGRLTHEQLQAQCKGPRVILERVAALGGTVDIDSSRAGTRLEITLPLDQME